MKTKLLALMLLAGGSLLAQTRFHFSIGTGYPRYYAPGYYISDYDEPAYYLPPMPPPRVVYAVPASPGYGYTWVDGYWYPKAKKWHWKRGYWARPPYARAYWVAPRYADRVYYRGYWRRR